MGQKVNPHGARVGVIMDWSTKWYAGKKDFSNNLIEDYNIRKLVPKLIDDFGKQRGGAVKEKRDFRGANPSISRIDVHRAGTKLHITVFTAKPGVVIGQGGQGVEFLKKGLEDYTGRQVQLDIMEIKNPDCDAQLVADSIAEQLERRISFRRAMKQAISRSMKAGAKGIKTSVSGRLGGADIARSEGYHEGSIPLQTLRANIDYGFCEARTTYGRIGVKVWIYKGQVLPQNGKKVLQGYTDIKSPFAGRSDRRRGDRNDRGPRGERRERAERPERKEGGN